MGGGNDEEFQVTTTHANSKEEPNVNLHQVIEDVQVKLVELMVTTVEVRELVILFVRM
jgi:phage shock protein A